MPDLDELKENRAQPDATAPAVPAHAEAEFRADQLLLQLADERERARRREAVLLSIIVHLCVFLFFLLFGKWLFHKKPNPQQLLVEQHLRNHQLTYIEAPPLPKPKIKVHSPVRSDQDRLVRHPAPPISVPQGNRGFRNAPTPPVRPQPAPPARAVAPQPPPGQTSPKPGKQREAGQKQQGLRLENVPARRTSNIPLGGMTIADQLRAAERGAAAEREGQGVTAATPRSHPGGPGRAGVTILTDTQGVDFDPYLRRIVHTVRLNWYAVMPEMAYMGRKGRVFIVFRIERNGSVPSIQLVSPSGTESLDRAAVAAISASNPFPPLPSQFHGPEIELEFGFFYNMLPPGQSGP